MSLQDIMLFYVRVSREPALSERYGEIMARSGSMSRNALGVAAAELGRQAGLDFSRDEFNSFMDFMQVEFEKLCDSGELSERDLSAVAGGAVFPSFAGDISAFVALAERWGVSSGVRDAVGVIFASYLSLQGSGRAR